MQHIGPRHFSPGAGLPGAGMPGDRGARIAARQAFVELKRTFLDALIHAADADWLRALVRNEFMAAMADIATDEADELRMRIHEARSLRELWHARAELFRLVGLTYSQTEAEQRLLLINRHFPTRAPRSQFAAL